MAEAQLAVSRISFNDTPAPNGFEVDAPPNECADNFEISIPDKTKLDLAIWLKYKKLLLFLKAAEFEKHIYQKTLTYI